MKNYRKYGKKSFNIAVIHGGPGAPGEIAPVAGELAADFGVLEPLQNKHSLKGQVEELQETLKSKGSAPFVLIGWSWGGMLSFLVSACAPELVKKLILVGSGVFEDKYASEISKTRMDRMNDDERALMNFLLGDLQDENITDKNVTFANIGKLLNKVDSYDPIDHDSDIIECQYDVHKNVWNEVQEFRKNDGFIKLIPYIKCPVVSIHGDYDPHPIDGIVKPLSSLKDFNSIILKNCGHYPWFEKHAKDLFYKTLKKEITK